jgi:hypothetical protein
MQRRNFIRSILAGLTGSALASTVSATPKLASDPTIDLTAEITALLRETEKRWDSQNTASLKELWDTDDTEPFYLAGEQDNWFIGWDELNAYLDPQSGPKITQAIRVRFYDIKARLLAPDLAFAGYWMRTDMKLVFQPKPFGSDNRVSAIFRRKPEGWRYLAYAEAFQAPNMYMNHLMEKDVPDDYQEFFNDVTEKK